MTLIEGISADGRDIPPFVIIEGQGYIEKWFNSKQHGDEKISVSDIGHTSPIRQITAHGFKKILLIDDHTSHGSADFHIKCF